MLLALMYHRVGYPAKHANSLDMLNEHLLFIKKRYPVVLPGDVLKKRTISVCLTFDDATFDFYYHIFPLLRALQLRALLGVPAFYIQESSTLCPQKRLEVSPHLAMQEGIYDRLFPFCTWQELKEMLDSGLVEMASHSYSHCNLCFPFVDLQREIKLSKDLLEQKLAQPVSSFIYPFGRLTPAVQAEVAVHYPYAFRIGSALNRGWGKGDKALCRLPADHLPHSTAPFSFRSLCHAYLKSFLQ